MAATPNASFSSDELKRDPANKGHAPTPIPSELPSPQSETYEDVYEAAEQAYQAVWDNFCGLPAHENPTFFLDTQQSYEHLYQRLGEHPGLLAHFEDSIRKHWNSATGKLTLYLMAPSPLHSFLICSVVKAVDKELDRIARSVPALRPFRSSIASGGDARVRRRSKSARRSRTAEFEKSPDAQWYYDGMRYPPFVLEVAYRQDGAELGDKVTELFEQLPGRICNILGMDVAYIKPEGRSRGSHTASLSLWTSRIGEDNMLEVVHSMRDRPVRGPDGQACPGDLILPFELFLPFKIRSRLPSALGPETHVHLTFDDLCNLVAQAEKRQRDCEGTASPSPGPESSHFEGVIFKLADGTVSKVTRVPVKRQRTGDADGEVLGRTRSQSRSQLRRSDRLRSRSVVGSDR